jgi:DNA-binding transcriptional ArsR family regulator
VDILSVLHDGPASAKELAALLEEPLSNITHHINELNKAGAIEVAHTKKVGNLEQHYWRGLQTTLLDVDDLATLAPAELEAMRRIITQSVMAELLSALRAGNLLDPRASAAWDRFWLDEEGYDELADFSQQFFEGLYDISARAAARSAKSGEELKPYVGGVIAFLRGRAGTNVRANVGHLGTEEPSGGESPFEK